MKINYRRTRTEQRDLVRGYCKGPSKREAWVRVVTAEITRYHQIKLF